MPEPIHLNTPTVHQEYDQLVVDAKSAKRGDAATIIDKDDKLRANTLLDAMNPNSNISDKARNDSYDRLEEMLKERFTPKIVKNVKDIFINHRRASNQNLTPNFIKKLDKYATSLEQSSSAQHSQQNFEDISHDNQFQKALKDEMTWKASNNVPDYIKYKSRNYGMKGVGKFLGGALKSAIPVVGPTFKFLADESTGNSIRLDAVGKHTAANPFAEELFAGLSGRSENQQKALGINSAVGAVISGPASLLPGSSALAHGVGPAFGAIGSKLGTGATKGLVSKTADKASNQASHDQMQDLNARRVHVKGDKSSKMSSHSAVFALTKYLSTPILSSEQINEMNQSSGAPRDVLKASQNAKAQIIESLGGDVELLDPKNVDPAVDDQLLRLMTKTDGGAPKALAMLIDIANNPKHELTEKDKQNFARLTKSSKNPNGFDLESLLQSPQVRSAKGKGFNYHNAALLASKIKKSNTFDYKFYEGTSLKSLYEDSPQYAPVKQHIPDDMDDLDLNAPNDKPDGLDKKIPSSSNPYSNQKYVIEDKFD